MESVVPGRKSQNRKKHKNILFWKKLQKKDQYSRNVVEKRKMIQKAGIKASTDNI